MWPFTKRDRAADTEERTGNWLAFDDLHQNVLTPAGTSVTEQSSVTLPAVYRCVTLNADVISSMPVTALVKRGTARLDYTNPVWLSQPDYHHDWQQFIAECSASYDLDGNVFILKAVDTIGRVAGLSCLSPLAVEPKLIVQDDVPRIVFEVDTNHGKETLAANEIIHIRGTTMPGALRGLSPIKSAAVTIGIGMAAEQFGAQFFGNGATLSGVIETPGKMDKDQADRLKDSFTKKHGGVSKSHAVGILTGGASWKPLSVSPNEAQFLETRKFSDIQIANMFGFPPEYVTDVEGMKGYVTALYQKHMVWLLTGINPRLTRYENAFSNLLARPAYIKFNRNALLQMDPDQRATYYASGIRDRWLIPDEARAREDLDPIAGGSVPLWSVQWQGSGAKFPVPPAPPPEPDQPDQPAA